MTDNFALAFTRTGTTLTFWLNKFSYGGHIWSLVRTPSDPLADDQAQRWNQPPLRFTSRTEAQAFILEHLAGNPEVRVTAVTD